MAHKALEIGAADVARVVFLRSSGPVTAQAGDLASDVSDLDSALLTLCQDAGQLYAPDLASDSSLTTNGLLASRLGATAGWALQVNTHFLGVLWIGFEHAQSLTPDQQDCLAILAAQTALAVANIRAYHKDQRDQHRLEAVLDSAADPMIIVDRNGLISLLNHAAEEVLGVQVGAVLEQSIGTVLGGQPRLLRFFQDPAAVGEEEEWTSPDDRTFSPRLSRVDSDTAPGGSLVLVLRDITHFKHLNKRQAEFVRLVSHDLRSPLTYMKGFASLLAMAGELNERQKGFVEKILGGITQMTALVENIQAAGRWDPEFGFYKMGREPTDLTTLAHEIVSNHQEVARKQNIVITAEVAANVPIVNVDSLMIERALINLVGNAIKYSPYGGTVRVILDVQDNAVVFCVSDTGLGVAPEHIPELFQRGHRIVTQAIKENRIKGSGLGLFIVRSVARRHGGDVRVESEPGKGSNFYFTLPLSGANLISGTNED